MEDNKKSAWEGLEKHLASEIIQGSERVSKAKDLAIVCLTIAVIGIASVMAIINYKNDCAWRELFASYDYITQDGEGFNYFNSEIGGDVNYGAENQETKEP